ncbi:cytochrome P450 [Aspergillus keveii]|uniref:Cytochrome P450 n=1 Tax=Aspergillus keveii TaxID=714993 RepID=A0ABR4FUS9_9EURO
MTGFEFVLYALTSVSARTVFQAAAYFLANYGNIVRTAPDELSFCSGASWKEIYGHVAGRKPFLKSAFYEPLPGETVNIVSVSDVAHHSAMRKTLSHGFSSTALSAKEDLVQGFVNLLIRQIKQNYLDKPGDMVKWYDYTTFDTIGELAFGDSFGCLALGEPHLWIDSLFDDIKITNLSRAFEYFPLLRSRFRSLYKRQMIPSAITAPRARQVAYAKDEIETRLNKNSIGPDFLTRMIAEREEKGFSFQERLSQASILVVAGSETTATSLAAITYYLCRNPSVYKKVAHEVRSSFKLLDEITGRLTEQLPYLRAVIEEGLRIFLPIPTGPPRVSPGEYVEGCFVPSATVVKVSPWAATHYNANFHQPYDFIPERWLDPECRDDKPASQPFLLGSRGCLGSNLAQLELRLILAKLLWEFDFVLKDKDLDWLKDNKSYGFWEKTPLSVQFSCHLSRDTTPQQCLNDMVILAATAAI